MVTAIVSTFMLAYIPQVNARMHNSKPRGQCSDLRECAAAGGPCGFAVQASCLQPEWISHGWRYQALCQGRRGSCENGLGILIKFSWPKLPASASPTAVAR